MLNDLSQERLLDEYDADYYALRLSEIPYERSAHWLNFFSLIADQLIRALQPRRVLDAGCAMGFLVEAFWDRGVYCEGIDISEYAISQVRRDIRSFCSVGSLDQPIQGRYDLITCIEVLEHLPPDILRPAVANLCEATDVLLFSSTPNELDEPTHYSVHPPIYWLQLFAEFGFWPDARFDAGFIANHTMLLRKGTPPSDDFLRLFSEYIRYKTAFETRSAETRSLQGELSGLRSQQDVSAAALGQKQQELNSVRAELAAWETNNVALRAQIVALQEQNQQQITALKERGSKLDELTADRSRLSAELDRFSGTVRTLQAEKYEINRLAEEQSAEALRLAEQVQTLTSHSSQVQGTLHAVLGSRAWRLAEKGRRPMRKLRSDWPRVHKIGSFIVRKLVGRRSAQAAEASGSSSQNEPPGPVWHTLAPARPIVTNDGDYQRWIDEREPNSEGLRVQRAEAALLTGSTFSIIIPVHETDHLMLQACIGSVLNQTYPRWQLCIAITPGGDRRNQKFLHEVAKRDSRIHLIEVAVNEGISKNSNIAMAAATGDFIVLLDHDDTLAPFALFEVTKWLNIHPDTDIIYSDHDYLDPEHGLRINPLFKPDWSQEIMFSANYITHLTVLRRSLLETVGLFDSSADGAQDWDLFLRASEATTRISHIPKVLYHWRMHAGSTAQNNSAKNYVADAQLRAISGHMQRLGMLAEPEVRPDGLLHVKFHKHPIGMVSIIIPTRDRTDLLSRCVSTLLSVTAYENFEVLIVDNGSREEATKEYFRSLAGEARVKILWHPGPFNYSAVNNRAVLAASGEYLLFLNNDVEITRPDWLTELVCWADMPGVGVAGAKLLRANGTLQHAGVVLGMSGFADHPFADEPALTFGLGGSTGWYRNFLAVTGACMMLRRTVFEEIGGFDEKFILCGSDVEICLRAHEHGLRIVYNPFAELIHHERQTRGTDVPANDFVESFNHYGRWLSSGDPYWNINLSLWSHQAKFRFKDEQSSFEFARSMSDSARIALAEAAPVRSASEEELMVRWFDCSEEQFEYLRQQNSAVKGPRDIKRLLWFIPAFEVPFYGGIYTILRFSDYWKREKNIESIFAVCGGSDRLKLASLIRQVHPFVNDDQVFVLAGNTKDAANLPLVDASICTLWTTPYYAVHHKNVGRRFYLIQDFEPAFYRAGSISALADSTYRMGLYGLANTVSLKQMYEAEYGGKATYFTPRINNSVFYHDESEEISNPRKPLQVFFYGRPKHARNAFELVKQAMLYLKARLGKRVRIVSAGDEWKPSEYGLEGLVENLGILAYEDTARLYRETQVGVVMMLTRHPSYIPLELMASGCLAVTNLNSWTSWLLKDGENCLLSPATATAIADITERGLLDTELRSSIRSKAIELVRSEYLDWSSQAEHIFKYLCDPEAEPDSWVNETETKEAAAS